MPTYKYVAVGPEGTEVKETAEAPSEDVLRNQLLLRNLEVRQLKQRRSFNELELTPQRVPKQEIMHFSARWRRSCAPASRSPMRSRSSRKAPEQQALQADPCRHARADPERRAVLRRARPSTRRCSRPTTSASCGRRSSPASSTRRWSSSRPTSSATSRRRRRSSPRSCTPSWSWACPSSRWSFSAYTCCRSSRSSSTTLARSCRCRRACCWVFRSSRRSSGTSVSACSSDSLS